MFNNKIFLLILVSFNSLFLSQTYAEGSPSQEVSGGTSCYYRVDGIEVGGSNYDIPWTSIDCTSSIDSTTYPDGVYDVYFKAEDTTELGGGANIMPETLVGTYKFDTQSPTCVLDEVTLYGIDNQYYNNGNFYYKSSFDASGKFVLDITCTDTEPSNLGIECNGTSCVSGLDTFSPQIILGDFPEIDYSKNSDEEKEFNLIYEWSGHHTDSFDILNNGTFISDLAGNEARLDTNNTSLIFKKTDGTIINTINNITKLQLVPDGNIPEVTGTFQYGVGNTLLGIRRNITNFPATYFSALDNREIYTPIITDLGSGLRGYNVNIENFNIPTNSDSTIINGSTLTTKSTQINTKVITHNFSDVSKNSDYNNSGYRPYSRNIKSLSADGTEITDKLCDMVGNCVSLTTPELNVVANIPDVSKSVGNFNSSFTGNVSNFDDEYNVQIAFKDKYNNEVVPVSGIKSINLTNTFINTLGVNQLTNPDLGDGVNIEFTDGNDLSIDKLNINGEYKNFIGNLTSKSELNGGELKISIKSAVPTHDEYITALNNPGGAEESMFGDLTAELRFEEFKIDVIGGLGYEGIGEFETVGNNFLLSLLPEFKFDPLVSFNYIGNIYPLVEGQYKNIDIGNIVLDDSELDNFDLNIKTSTNNIYLQVTKSSLEVNNNIDGTWKDDYNEYNIIDLDSTFAGSVGNGNMENNSMGTFKILPQTIGGITDDNTKIALFSELSYLTNGMQVTLPGIQTGFKYFGVHEVDDFYDDTLYNDDSSIIFSEIKISGITQSNNVIGSLDGEGAVTTDNSTFNDFSKITLFDLKTNINKNVSMLLKGENISDALFGSDNTINDINNFTENQGLVLQKGDVLYIKDRDITIDCSGLCEISGNKTIIIENGNLTINSDMYYYDNNSILGIILIGNESSGDTSQLRISEHITNGVGIVYAEGPVVSVNGNDDIYDGNNVGENLVNQLHWKGSFMTRNTVGGSILDLDIRTSCPYGTPDYEQTSCTQEIAQAYDLIYLRRYARVKEETYYSSTNNPMGDEKVPLHYDTRDVKIAGGITISANGISMDYPGDTNLINAPDKYDAPFILDYDSNIQTNPPYGFEQ